MNIKSSKGKATSNIQGKPHMFNSWSFSKNASGKKGMVVYIKVLKGKNLQPRLPRKDLIQNWWRNQKLSVQFSHSVVSDSLRPHELQHARPPCPTRTPRAYPNSCPFNQWCHRTISSSVIPCSSCPQFLPLFQWVNSSHEVAKVLEFQL